MAHRLREALHTGLLGTKAATRHQNECDCEQHTGYTADPKPTEEEQPPSPGLHDEDLVKQTLCSAPSSPADMIRQQR
ncbi:hypothetical protein EYF80_006911 [Liparis tanakae]|uniref:Uncharacterized protein n=1 Tax=Liparis tanakae TaxID=230148 RepID=A0A4Z2IZH7_9TELE|nr:hypothetical protein EYF80_006911 [Liparis tanakae]